MSSLYSIQYMQDMTHSICADAKENDTVQLIDKRSNADGTNPKYWVTKLRDGNCWMTQNLDLDIPASGLTAALSDMTTGWNSTTNASFPPVATQTGSTPSFTGSSSAPNVVQSWDPGLRVCDAANGCNEPTTTDYNEHYIMGNFYSWTAATAGAGNNTLTAGSVNQSICPKNWALPANGAYGNLFASYGTIDVNNNLVYGEQSILNAPLYFVYGGSVGNSSLSNAGSRGYYWSSTASNASSAYGLYFIAGVSPSNNGGRYVGMSVRCVAR